MSDNFNFVDTELGEIRKTLLNGYQEIMGEKIYSGDPMSDFIDYATFIVTLVINSANEVGKQNLLKYSRGEALEELGALVGETREQATPALTTVRYTFSRTFNSVITVPQGHKTEGNGLYFQTTEIKDLKIGDIYVDIQCECLTPGVIGNGIEVGEIKNIVNVIPYLESIKNLTVSGGGSELEEDETLKERIRLAPASKSTAGPESSYVYHTKKAHRDICDVFIYTTPGTGIVNIVPLMNGGIVPGIEVLNLVTEYLNNKEIKPLTDIVNCIPAEVEKYNIDISYYIYEDDFSVSTKIKEQVNNAINNYILWQSQKLGRDINPDQLKRYILNAGAKRCLVREPTYTVINRGKVAKNISKNIIYGGIENE
ncbi:MAG: baseplate J/gp47 family protein [Fusobacteriaceae bacterium]